MGISCIGLWGIILELHCYALCFEHLVTSIWYSFLFSYIRHEVPQAEVTNAHENSVWDLAWHPMGHILCRYTVYLMYACRTTKGCMCLKVLFFFPVEAMITRPNFGVETGLVILLKIKLVRIYKVVYKMALVWLQMPISFLLKYSIRSPGCVQTYRKQFYRKRGIW
jgi:hypothetical protein